MPIHPTAYVHPKAAIHPSVEIGPYCTVDEHVTIEANTRLYQNVFVSGWTTIGADCILHPNVIVGHEPQDVRYKGERSFCRVGRGTILREFVTIHRGTLPDSETIVGEECFLLACTHVAHNCRVGNNVTLINNVLLAGHVEVGDRTVMGGASVAHQFVRIGQGVMVPGCARTVKDVPPYALINLQGRFSGLNVVGMRRAGLTSEERLEVRKLYRHLYARGTTLLQALAAWGPQASGAAAQAVLTFLHGESKRGITGRERGRRSGMEDLPERD